MPTYGHRWCCVFLSGLVYRQARNQLGTPGGAKSFPRGPNFLNYIQNIFPGGRGRKFEFFLVRNEFFLVLLMKELDSIRSCNRGERSPASKQAEILQ